MKKILIASMFFLSAGILNANPGRGGYLGHQFIIGVEGAYSPFYTSAKDFFTKYNFQYGGSFGVITGRRTQLNLNYNMWSLGGNQAFSEAYVAGDRVKGSEYVLTLRTFRKKRGGIAPIGKFYDIGFTYSRNKFVAGSDNANAVINPELYKMESNQFVAHLAFGTQMVFWNRVVGNTGIRLGLPTFFAVGPTTEDNFMSRRIAHKEYFSVFFGLGVLL